MPRIASASGQPFRTLLLLSNVCLQMKNAEQALANRVSDEEADSMVIDAGYCIDRLILINHPYPRRT